MSISIMVVDDVRSIAEGFAGKFRRFSNEQLNVDVDVEVLCSSDEAVSRISDESKPLLDLLFTDIDLNGGDCPDRAGVALARYAKAMIPGIPLVGCSGRFEQDDLSDEERGVFNMWWSKGGLSQNLSKIAEDTLDKAISYHKKRQSQQTKMKNDCDPIESQSTDSLLHTPKTNEEFKEEGYVKAIIEPTNQNGLMEPFAVWKKDSQEGVELEVLGCGALFSWGDTYEDAEAGLMEVIKDLKLQLQEPDESFTKSLLLAKRFVETVTGSRNITEGE
ncbi:MAG: response regulator [Chlorobium sp.]|jgi:hypothetical protein|nr:response regulator [Chlorobium sp.]